MHRNAPTRGLRFRTDVVRRIERLRDEAATGNDAARVVLCERALDGDLDVLGACVRVLREAELRVDGVR